MAKYLRRLAALVLALALITPLTALAVESGTGKVLYENTLEIVDGFTYKRVISENSVEKRVDSYFLGTKKGSTAHPIVLACDTVYGGMTASRMASYAESVGYNVVGMVNADFFSTSSGVPLGIVIENGRLVSSAHGENALAFDSKGAFVCQTPKLDLTLENKTNGRLTTFLHFNKLRTETGGLYLYTSDFSTVSTRTTTNGWAVRMKITDGDFSVGGTTELVVEEVVESGKEFTIGDGYAVLTADKKAGYGDTFKSFSVGDKIVFSLTSSDTRLLKAEWATGCGDIMARGGRLTNMDAWDSALFNYHPRTAAGVRDDGTLVCYVADGRSDRSYGARMSQAAEDLIAEGCTTVVNLDGGGSAVMSVRLPGTSGCGVVSNPSEGRERANGSYILFVTDDPPENTGKARKLFTTDDPYVLAGGTVELSFIATDAFARRAETPTDVKMSVSTGGSVSGTAFRAGKKAGDVCVKLSSASTGASGYGTVHVITAPDTVTIIDAETGKAPALSSMKPGDVVKLAVKATHLGKNVVFDASSVKWSVSGGFGTIGDDGVFTASGGTGDITATVGESTASAQASVHIDGLIDITGHWAEKHIRALYDAGIITDGVDGRYRPDEIMTRCDFVVMLWMAAGKPAPKAMSGYKDVPDDSYYAKAVAWAKEKAVTYGVGNNRFNPDGSLTREQAFSLVYRYLDTATGLELAEPNLEMMSEFSDEADVADYARDAVGSLITAGVVNGSYGKLKPKNKISRGEMATVLNMSLTKLYKPEAVKLFG